MNALSMVTGGMVSGGLVSSVQLPGGSLGAPLAFPLGGSPGSINISSPLQALTIMDYVVTFPSSGVHAVATEQVIAYPSVTPIFVRDPGGTAFYEVSPPTFRTAYPDGSGAFSLVLPWPADQDPITATWIIVMPDGTRWTGTVPQGFTGPVNIKKLKDLYGWKSI